MTKFSSNALYGAIIGAFIALVISFSGLYRLPLYYLIPAAILFGLSCALVARLFGVGGKHKAGNESV
jgi:hypothetical protein